MPKRDDRRLESSIDHFGQLINEQGGQAEFVKRLAAVGVGRLRNSVAGWMNVKNHAYPNGETLTKIADAFDVSTDWLLGRTEDRQGLVGAQRVEMERFVAERQRLFVSLAQFILDDLYETTRRKGKMETDPAVLVGLWDRRRRERGLRAVQSVMRRGR